MDYIYDDGGREAAGYKGSTGDCTVRAIAIACELPYQKVYDDLNLLAKEFGSPRGKTKREYARTGVSRKVYDYYLHALLAWRWTPTMTVGQGCQVHLTERELPGGRLICRVSKHHTAVVDHIIRDTHDPSRGGTRCVYGYWSPPGSEPK